jgi:hypothetical protein
MESMSMIWRYSKVVNTPLGPQLWILAIGDGIEISLLEAGRSIAKLNISPIPDFRRGDSWSNILITLTGSLYV